MASALLTGIGFDSIKFRLENENGYNLGVAELRVYTEGGNVIIELADNGAGDVDQNAWKRQSGKRKKSAKSIPKPG